MEGEEGSAQEFWDVWARSDLPAGPCSQGQVTAAKVGGEISRFLPKTRWSSRFWESSGWMCSHPVQGREDGAEPGWIPAAGRALRAESSELHF